jgi:penicillin-binding protein 2
MNNPFAPYTSKKYKLDSHGKSIQPPLAWEEGAFGDRDNADDFYEGHTGSQSFWLLAIAVAVVFVVLTGKIVFLQTAKGKYYTQLANINHIRTQPIFAPRGIIYDSQGETLVQNVPNFELDATTADLPKDYSAEVQALAAALKVDPSQINSKLATLSAGSYQEATVISSIDKDSAVVFESETDQFPGFEVENDPIRQYVDPLVFSHPIGYTGKINADELAANPNDNYLLNDYIGKDGIEESYEKYLRGTNGQHQVEVDASGKAQEVLGDIPPQPGDNVTLNIDAGLQRVLYQDLITKNPGKDSAAVALDPQTGQILALVSTPGFNTNLFATGISQAEYSSLENDPTQPLFNNAISGQYPSGSTIKPVMAAAALQENVVTAETKIDDNGDLVVGAFNFHGWMPGGLGMMDIRSAIAMSSDIYFYTVGGGQQKLGITGLGPERIAKYEAAFGLGAKSGIDLPGEAAGLIASPEERQIRFAGNPAEEAWYLGDTYHESIGQGDQLVTPLQDAMWIATIANGGTLYKPYVVNKVTDANGNVVLQNKPTVIRQVPVSAANIKIVQEGMRQAVTAGTATSLKNLPIEVAAKTGTAQFDDANLSASHGWFAAYAPYQDPQIVIVDLVAAGGEGVDSALPTVKDALQWWAENRYLKNTGIGETPIEPAGSPIGITSFTSSTTTASSGK